VGTGEQRALGGREIPSGNVKLAMSHVLLDLIQKVAGGQDLLHVFGDGTQVRRYAHGGDLAYGIRLCMERPAVLNQDFNLSTAERTTVLQLTEIIWRKIRLTLSGAPIPATISAKPRRML
jgi:UDP-glucose 4-epimerase